MNDYIEKAYSVEKDIVGMEPYEQLKFVSKLYNEMAQIPPAEIGNINDFCKAHTHVESVWNYLLDDYKKSLVSELEQKISDLPYCSSCNTNDKDKNIIINVEISELFFAEICYKWGSSTINISILQRIKDRYDNISFFNVVVRWKLIPDWLKNTTKYIQSVIVCDDTDFRTSLIMARVLLQHTANVFGQLPSTDSNATRGTVTVLCQTFFNSLPSEFNRRTYLSIAERLHVAPKTAEKYIRKFCTTGQIKHLAHDSYIKP